MLTQVADSQPAPPIPALASWHLVSAWASLCCYRDLGSEAADGAVCVSQMKRTEEVNTYLCCLQGAHRGL